MVAPCIHAAVFNQDGNVNENKNGMQKLETNHQLMTS